MGDNEDFDLTENRDGYYHNTLCHSAILFISLFLFWGRGVTLCKIFNKFQDFNFNTNWSEVPHCHAFDKTSPNFITRK